MVKDVEWQNGFDSFHRSLHIPERVYSAVIEQAPSQGLKVTTQVTSQLCEWYLVNHPSPSWSHVADALYYWEEHEALEVLRDEVPSLKGEHHCCIVVIFFTSNKTVMIFDFLIVWYMYMWLSVQCA